MGAAAEHSIVSALLFFLTLSSTLHEGRACMKTALDNGYMEDASLISSITLGGAQGPSSCTCCALCHQDATCASLAYNGVTQECRLYGAVSGYTTFTIDNDWQYFVMPGWSQHEQFCRTDSDCQVSGDACRGRICTTETAVYCSTIYDVYMSGGAQGQALGGQIVDTYGWMNGAEKRFGCKLDAESPGFTMLFRNKLYNRFTTSNLYNFNEELADNVVPYSQLLLSAHFRALSTDPNYRIQVYTTHRDTEAREHFISIDIPRAEPLVGSGPRDPASVGATIVDSGTVTMPSTFVWTLLHATTGTASILTFNGNGGDIYIGSMARTDGGLNWGAPRGIAVLLMHE